MHLLAVAMNFFLSCKANIYIHQGRPIVRKDEAFISKKTVAVPSRDEGALRLFLRRQPSSLFSQYNSSNTTLMAMLGGNDDDKRDLGTGQIVGAKKKRTLNGISCKWAQSYIYHLFITILNFLWAHHSHEQRPWIPKRTMRGGLPQNMCFWWPFFDEAPT